MDVLTAAALTVNHNGEQDCIVRLLEYLGAARDKNARRLRRVVREFAPRLGQDLKRTNKRVEEILNKAANSPADSDATPATMAKALQLAAELNQPTRLTKGNLHPFRLRVKELRDVLQLSDQSGGQELIEALGGVKDAIGEWHDWEELAAIAPKVLDHGTACQLIKRLKATRESKYQLALSLTNQLRNKYLKREGRTRKARPGQEALLSTPVLTATSGIAQR